MTTHDEKPGNNQKQILRIPFLRKFEPSRYKSYSVIFLPSQKSHGCMTMTQMLAMLNIPFSTSSSICSETKHAKRTKERSTVYVLGEIIEFQSHSDLGLYAAANSITNAHEINLYF